MNRFTTSIMLTFSFLFMVSCGETLLRPGEGFEEDEDAIQTESDTIESEDSDSETYDKDSLDKSDIDYEQKPDDDSGDGPYCGNGFVDPGEVCDKSMVECLEIDESYTGGRARCLADCTGWNTDKCVTTINDEDSVTTPDEDSVTKTDEDAVVTPDEDSVIIPDEDSVTTPDEDAVVAPDEDAVVTPDEDIFICTNECSIENSSHCSTAGEVISCLKDADGCLQWQSGENCTATNRTCDYSLTISVPDENNIRTTLFKGTFIEITATRTLEAFDQYLKLETEEPLTFVIYESSTKTGTYTKIRETIVTHPGNGQKFYNSGSLTDGDTPLLLQSGSFYLIGVAWEGSVTSFYKSGFFSPQVETTPFGTTFGGLAADATWPPPATLLGNSVNNSAYYQRFYTKEDNTTATCECNNECSLNDTQCEGDILQMCDENKYSCTYWTLQENCAMNFPIEICEEGPSGAECIIESISIIDTIGEEDTSYTNNAAAVKGNYVSVDTDTTITAFQFHLQAPSTTTVSFFVYESDSLSSGYNRVFVDSLPVTNILEFYGPSDITLNLTAGKYYLFALYLPGAGYSYYYTNTQHYSTAFGDSEGSENYSSQNPPGATSTNINGPSTSSYHMTITSE